VSAPGERVFRVSFTQWQGDLTGRCWCGRSYDSADPRDMWTWLEDHEHAEPGEAGPGVTGDAGRRERT
jgi:hypothetical protein